MPFENTFTVLFNYQPGMVGPAVPTIKNNKEKESRDFVDCGVSVLDMLKQWIVVCGKKPTDWTAVEKLLEDI